MLGLRRQLAQQVVAKPQVLGEVGLLEAVPGQGPCRVTGVDERLRVGGHGQHHGQVELAGHLRGHHRADVGHPEVDHVDAAGGLQDPADAAPRRDPCGPGSGHPDRHTGEGHAGVVVPRGAESGVASRTIEGRGAAAEGEVREVGSAARDRDDPLDVGLLAQQRVTELDEQRGDPSGVTSAGVVEPAVDVRVEEQLGDGEPVRDGGRGGRVEVVQGEAGGFGQRADAPADRPEQVLGSAIGGRARAQCRHRCRSDPEGLAVVTGQPQQEPGRGRARDESQGLDQPRAGEVVDSALHPLDEGRPDRSRLCGRPSLEGALRQHPGKPAVVARPDEQGQGIDDQRGEAECVHGVLRHGGSPGSQQPGQHRSRGRVAAGPERVHRGDGGERVARDGCGPEQDDRVVVGARGGERQAVRAAHPFQEGGSGPDRRERKAGIHVINSRSPAPSCRGADPGAGHRRRHELDVRAGSPTLGR